MKKNLFEMGSSMGGDLNNAWISDNKTKKRQRAIEQKEPNKHQLYFSKEKRRGKIVTIVQPFYLDKDGLNQLLKKLKSKLGTGGTIKDNSLEIQGEKKDILAKELTSMGYRLKR